MEEWQKEYITDNLPDLIELTKFNTLVKAHLRSKRILGSADRNKLKAVRDSLGEDEEASEAYDILFGRQLAYEILTEALVKTKQSGAADILLKGLKQHRISHSLTQLGISLLDNHDTFGQSEILVLGKSVKVEEFFFGKDILKVQEIFRESLSEKCYHDTFVKQQKSFELVKNTIPPKPQYYIPRYLFNKIQLDEMVFQEDCPDIFVFKNIDWHMLSNLAYPNRAYSSRTQLENICTRFIDLDRDEDWKDIVKIATVPVHLIHIETVQMHLKSVTHIVLKNSSGNSDILKKYGMKRNQVYMTEDDFASQQTNEESAHGVCICDTSGMGKTLLLASIARSLADKSSTNIVMFIPLVKFFQNVDQPLRRFTNKEQAASYLFQHVFSTHKGSTLLFDLTLHKFATVKLFLDGFDEIQSDEQLWMIQCLQSVLSILSTVKLYVTSNPGMKTRLEGALGVIAYEMIPFNTENQTDYLVNFWSAKMPNIEPELIENYAKVCLREITNTNSKRDLKIAGIPLQCRLIAEVYASEVNQISLAEDETFTFSSRTLCKMYRSYVENNVTRATTNPTEADNVKKLHVWYAMQLIFPQSDFITDVNHLDTTNEMILKTGLMVQVTGEECPKLELIHRTFAEFLVADYFAGILSEQYDFAEMKRVEFLVKEVLTPKYGASAARDVIAYFLDAQIGQTLVSRASKKRLATVVSALSQMRYNDNLSYNLLNSACEQDHIHIFHLLKDVLIIMHPNKKIQQVFYKVRLQILVHDIIKSHKSVQILKDTDQIITQIFKMKLSDVSYQSYNKCQLVNQAAECGNYEAVEYLMDRCPLDLNDVLGEILRNFRYCNTLSEIVKKAIILRLLLRKYPSCISQVSDIVDWVNTPTDIMKVLVEFGVNIDMVRKGNNLVYFMKQYFGDPFQFHELIEWLLLDHVIDIIFVAGFTLRDYLPCIFENVRLLLKTFDLLLKVLGFDVNEEINGENLLFSAVRGSNLHVVQELVKRGADPRKRGRENKSLLHLWQCYVDINLASYLVSLGLDSNCSDANSNSPLHQVWHVSHAKLLLEHGADVNTRNNNGESVLHTAVQNGDTELMRYFVSKGLNVNDCDSNGNTSIHYCRDLKVLECLVELGVEICAKNKYGQSVLHIVAACGPRDLKSMFEYLLCRGLNINDMDNDGKTPLDYCMHEESMKVIEPLLNIWGKLL